MAGESETDRARWRLAKEARTEKIGERVDKRPNVLRTSRFVASSFLMLRRVDSKLDASDIFSQNGATALHFAALNARFEAMSYLMDHDVDINIHDGAGCTPLAW